MKRLIVLAAITASLMTSACITVIDADDDHIGWTGENAQPFDGARDACRETAGTNQSSRAFESCMAAKGWTRGED